MDREENTTRRSIKNRKMESKEETQCEGKYDETTPITKKIDHSQSNYSNNCCSCIPKRYILAFMAFFGYFNLYSMRVTLSIAIVDMTNNETLKNGTTVSQSHNFDWDSRLQGTILASFFYGYIATPFIAGIVANRVGGKYLFGIGTSLAGILTLLSPALAHWSPYALLGGRILKGMAEGITYPGMHALWRGWAPSDERTRLVTLGFSGSYSGAFFALMISGILSQHLGWESVFYLFGTFACLWSVLWYILIAETPKEHPCITEEERNYIEANVYYKKNENIKQSLPPWKCLVTCVPLFALLFCNFAENWGHYTNQTLLPTYMHDILRFNLSQAGFYSSLPYLVMAVLIILGGHLADWLRSRWQLSTTTTRKIFVCAAFGNQALFTLITCLNVSNASVAITCLIIGCGLNGLAWAGIGVNELEIAPSYASIIMGISQTTSTVPGIVSPTLAGYIVVDKTPEEWQIVFAITACFYVVAATVYLFFGSGEAQSWGIQAEIEQELPPLYVEEEEEYLAMRDKEIKDEDNHGND